MVPEVVDPEIDPDAMTVPDGGELLTTPFPEQLSSIRQEIKNLTGVRI